MTRLVPTLLILAACGDPKAQVKAQDDTPACPQFAGGAGYHDVLLEAGSADQTHCAAEQRPRFSQEGCKLKIEGDAKISGTFTLDSAGKASVSTTTGTIDVEVTINDYLYMLVSTYRESGTGIICKYSTGNLK